MGNDDDRKLLGDGSEVDWVDESTVDGKAKRGVGDALLDGLRSFAGGLKKAMEPLSGCTICGGEHHPMHCPKAPEPRRGVDALIKFSRKHRPGVIIGEGQCRECGAPKDVVCNYWAE